MERVWSGIWEQEVDVGYEGVRFKTTSNFNLGKIYLNVPQRSFMAGAQLNALYIQSEWKATTQLVTLVTL